MTKAQVREYMYENNVRGDLSIESMAEDIGTSQGEWIHDYHFGLALPEHKCSVCGEWEYSDTESNFCPHCGARMKGADDE